MYPRWPTPLTLDFEVNVEEDYNRGDKKKRGVNAFFVILRKKRGLKSSKSMYNNRYLFIYFILTMMRRFFTDHGPDRRRKARRDCRKNLKNIWSSNWSKRTAWPRNNCGKYRTRRWRLLWSLVHRPCRQNWKVIRPGEPRGQLIKKFLKVNFPWKVLARP